tara:strand:- start:120 stop:686 length:567 start_codon:yes stop_codon:yes gene_type:complete
MTKKFSLAALVALLGLSLAGCAPREVTLPVSPKDTPRVNALLADPAAVRAFFADTTTKVWHRNYGTQIVYHSADGRTWLVFPGNKSSLTGFWKISGSAGDPKFCYRYPNSRDAVSGRLGDVWKCGPAAFRLFDDEIVDGDVLGLQKRAETVYPQTLPRKFDISISEVREAIGLGPLREPNKTFWQKKP